jgi:iron complex transport system substrate-binding protein
LERFHKPIFAVDPSTFEETYDALRKLGAITGQTRQAEQVVTYMKKGVLEAQAAITRGAARPKVLWIVQSDPLIVVGSQSFMDDLITLAGGENAGRVGGKGWPTLSPERVISLRPDVILAGRETAASARSRAAWQNVPAISKGHVYSLASEEAVRPGPRLVSALSKLVTLLHPGHSTPR